MIVLSAAAAQSAHALLSQMMPLPSLKTSKKRKTSIYDSILHFQPAAPLGAA
jgi:hypothetical protein